MKDKVITYCKRITEICLYLAIFCLPFTRAGLEIFVWWAISAWMIKMVLSYNKTKGLYGLFPATKLNRAIGLFVIVNVLTLVTSVVLGLSARAFFGKILKFVFLYFIVVETIIDQRRLKNILVAILLSAAFILADAAVQYFTGRDFLQGIPFKRLSASFSNSNGFAGWLIMVIPIFSGSLALKQSNWLNNKLKKGLLAGLIFFLLICLVLTYSRGAWLGFLFGTALIGFSATKLLSLRNKILAYLLMLICLIQAFFVLPAVMKHRLVSIKNINTSFDRIYFWREALSIIEDFPILGCGLNTYSRVAPHYKIFEEGGLYPHNSFLQMAAETGIIGVASFVYIIMIFFKIGFQFLKKRNNPLLLGLLAGIWAFLVQSFFDNNLFSLPLVVLFWLMLGLAVAITKLKPDANL